MPTPPQPPLTNPEDIIKHSLLFHGHIGPYNIFGVMVGLMAKRILGFKGHFDVKVTAYCGRKTPFSCMADGLQLATGATLGKGNISVKDFEDGPVKAVFESNGKTCEIHLTKKALEIGDLGMISWERGDQAGREALAMDESELFIVKS